MLDQYGEKIIGGLFALWLAVLTFWGKRELDKLDGKADEEDLKSLIRRLDEHMADDRNHQDKVADALLEISKSVARIEGRLAE